MPQLPRVRGRRASAADPRGHAARCALAAAVAAGRRRCGAGRAQRRCGGAASPSSCRASRRAACRGGRTSPTIRRRSSGSAWSARNGSSARSPCCSRRPTPALLDGDALVHCDVRSDNLCLRERPCRAARLESRAHRQPRVRRRLLAAEPRARGWSRPRERSASTRSPCSSPASSPRRRDCRAPDGAPRVRSFQRAQLEVALPWACTALGLPVH